MRTGSALAFVLVLTCVLGAQQAAAPAPAGARPPQVPAAKGPVLTAAEVTALIAAQPSDRNTFSLLMQSAGYNVNMEHRVMGQGAAVHDLDAELFFVIDGSGTIVTGGKLIGEQRQGNNLNGTGIEGGQSRSVTKGDWILVPPGVAHWVPNVKAPGLTLMSLHLPMQK